MKVFVRVAQLKSFSRVADELNLPRATVSMAVQQLEGQLGLRLLNRTTRSVSLTSDGENVLTKLLHLLNEFEAIEMGDKRDDTRLTGTLRVEAPTRFARLVFAPHLSEFINAHPKLHVELRSSDRAVNLTEEAVDCAIRVGTLSDSSLVSRSLGTFKIINCASPAYLKHKGVPSSNSDLTQHQVVQFVSPTTGKVAAWEYQQRGKTHTIYPPSSVSVNNAETYIACALAGLGLIQIPAYDVQDDLLANRLIEVLSHESVPGMPVHLVYQHRRHLSQRVLVFMDWVAQLIARERLI